MPLNPAKQLDIVFNPEKPYTLRLGALKTFRNSPALRRGTEEFQASDHDTVKSKLLDLLFEDCAQLERNFRSMLLEILMISHDDDCVGVRLDAMLKSGIEIKSHSSTKQLFRFTTVILALLDTPMGLTLVRQRLNKILEALTRELYSVLNAIKTESWMHLNLNQSCHNLLQATLCLVTRTRHPIDERTGDNMFSAVLRVCSSPIFDSDFRTVIGIICANIAIGMDLMARFLSVIFDDQCNSQRKLNSVLSEPEMRLMYILGLLNCSLDTIEAARPGSFTALFSIIVEDLKYDHDTRIVGLQCLSKWLNCSIIRKLDFLAVSPEIFKTIFDTIIGNLGYQIDKVQDLLRDIFLAYLRCIATLDAKAEFKSLLLYLQNNLPNDKAAKYDFIAMLLPFIDDAAVDTASNELIETSFKNISNSNITKAIVNSLVAFIRRSSSGAAIDHVANHLSISLVSNDPIIRDLSNRIVLPQLVKSKRDFLDLVASELLRLPSDSISTSHAILNMMQIGRKSGKPLHILGGVTDSLESTLRDCLLSTSNELRFSALAYILEGFKRSTEITESEFEMVKLFLRNHISLDSRHRRKFMLSMNRFLYRIKCLLYSNIREIENLNSKIRYSKIDNQAALYLQIQNEEAKIYSMFPGASFHRIGGSLDLLQTRSEVESLIIDTNAKSLLQNVAGYNMEIISKDVHLLASKYLFETDHEARLVYSSYIRRTNDPIAIQSVRTVIENHYSSLLDSINAADQESGALLARLSFTLLNDVATQDMQATAAECKHVPNLVAYIQYLVEKLDSNVRVAVENISFSSQKYPLNGWLSSIRNTLEVQFQQKDIWKSDGPWYDLLLRIGNLGLRACQCVLEVCSNESPEGNMPASFREIHENIELGITEASQLEDTGAIAQIVLRHCFRVVKEATDCLLSIIISIPKEYLDRFMPLCLTFGSLLCKLISTVRHRGAIGAAQVNFAKLCSYFISCGNQELRMIPRRWLDDFLGQIQDLEISVTRRSAGLPMAILSVINSPPSAHEKSNYLRFAVEQLLEMFDSDLNIRKEQMDLAESSELAAHIRPYIESIYTLCFEQFCSPHFPVRNCSAMLFSALIDKSLGCRISKDLTDTVNFSTTSEFFGQFRTLHEDLLERFREAVFKLWQGSVHPLLYPILNILSRILPNSDKGSDSRYSLAPYLVLVISCTSASQWKVRELAARTASTLVRSSIMISQLQVILKRCDPSSLTNTVHGDMLHIKYLLERHVKQDEQIEYYQEISHIFEGFSWIYEKRCFAVPAMVLIDMVFYYSLLFSQKYDWGKCTTQAAYACVEIIKLANTEILPGVDTFSAKAETMMGMLISLNNDLPYAHTADTLHSGIILPNSKHLELAFDKLTIELKNRNRSGLQRPRHGICADADSKSNPTSIVCDISLVLLRPLPFSVVQHLITLIGKKIGLLDIGSTAFEKPWQQFACIAHTKLHGDSPVEVRAAICGALKAISRIVNIKEKEARNKYQIEFVILVIECSQDDDETVRELAAEVISTILPSGSGTHSAIISRILLMGYISRTATSAAATCWESYLCKQLTQFACLQAAIDAQTGTSKALFNREVLNAFREPVIDILAICQSLMLLQTTSSTNLDSALQSLSTILEQNIEILAKMKPCEQFWQSGEPQFFAAALALVGIAHVVNETESLKLIMQANVNPFIHEAAEMGSSDTGGWHFLCSMLLGTLDMQMSVL